MDLVCPLCLKTLEGQTVGTFCVRHGVDRHSGSVGGVYRLDGERGVRSFPESAIIDEGCRSIQNGLQIAHFECDAQSPIWDPEANEVRPPADRVKNWQANLLKQIALLPHLRQWPSMWYPLRLMLAASRIPNENSTRVGLVGVQECGKTVIATMALCQHAYVRQRDPESSARDDRERLTWYLYERPNPESAFESRWKAFKEWGEFIHGIAQGNPTGSEIVYPGTSGPAGHVRAVFFDRFPRGRGAGGSAGSALAEKGRWAWMRSMKKCAAEWLDDFNRASPQEGSTILFYDAAGEHAELGFHPLIADFRNQMDIVALVLDAEDLSKGEPMATARGTSHVGVAIDQIRSLSGGQDRPRVALVLTKCDRLADPERERFRHFTSEGDSEVRQFAARLVDRSTNLNKGTLLDWLSADQPIIDRVFAVGTEGLEQGRPVPIHIGTFVNWCRTST